LKHNREAVAELNEHVQEGPVTFVYAASDQQHNSAVVLKEFLEGEGKRVKAGRV
jgi:uncharacterized protein YeaO (DUF488 family)